MYKHGTICQRNINLFFLIFICLSFPDKLWNGRILTGLSLVDKCDIRSNLIDFFRLALTCCITQLNLDIETFT